MPRVATWNMQGGTNWPYMRYVLAKLDPDVLCVQECGKPPDSGNFAPTPAPGILWRPVDFGKQSAPRVYCIYWWWNAGATQQSLAILTRAANIPNGLGLIPAPATGGFGRRPIPVANVTLNGTAFDIASLHAPSVYSATAQQITNYGQAAAATVAALTGNGDWLALGDWNTDSATIAAGGFGVVNADYATQQQGYAIDYLVSATPPPVAVQAQTYDELPFASDHLPVAFGW